MGRHVIPVVGPSASQIDKDARNIPPSTINALVQHQSRAKTAGPQDGNDYLAIFELLQDIRRNPKEHLTDDLDVHCVLIYALVQEFQGLAGKTDPFDNRTKAIDHALSCLVVIEMTLSRTPKVLFHRISQGAATGSELCLWILPKLLAAMNDWDVTEVTDRIQETLDLCLNLFNGSFRSRHLMLKMQRFYECCVGDLLSFIRGSPGSRPLITNITASLPSVGARETISGYVQQPMVVNDDCQITFNSPSHATNIALVLTTSLGRTAKKYKKPVRDMPIGHTSTAWLVEVLHHIWESGSSGVSPLMTPVTGARVMRSYANSLVVIAALVETAEHAGGVASRVHLLLARSLLRCLSSIESSAVANYQEPLIILSRLILPLAKAHDVLPLGLKNKLSESTTGFMERNIQPHSELFAAIREVFDALTPSDAKHTRNVGSSRGTRLPTNGIVDHVPSRAPAEPAQTSPHPSKRQKLNSAMGVVSKSRFESGNELLGRLCSLLGDWNRKDLRGLKQAAAGLFSDLSGSQQEQVLAILAELPISPDEKWKNAEWNSFHDILCALLDTKEVLQSKVLRIMTATAVKAITKGTPVTGQLDLTTSALGKWCLQGLRSSVRQLRMLAALTLRNFMQAEPIDERTRKNRLIILDVLRQFADLNDARWSESLIVAFGEVACCCDEDERAIAINQLIEYLGHTSKMICDMAYLELKHVADTLGYSKAIELLDPFWRVTGVTVVKDLLTRPQKVQQLADLVGFHVDQLLVHIQAEVLPWLVLEKKQDILLRIARARGEKTSVLDVCMHRRNLPAILAAIVVQHPDEIEAAISSCLSHASSDFYGKEPVEFLKAETIALACEILKVAGDKDRVGREKAIHGFREFTLLVEKRGHSTKAASTQARMSTLFYENHALGIMNIFSTVIDNDQDSLSDKRRCLIAIEQFVVAGQNKITVALPQIRACLQSALKASQLQDSAFMAWHSVVTALQDEEELDGLIEQTFATIVQNWESFSPHIQQLAYDLVSSLIKEHGDMIQANIASVPSLTTLLPLSKFETQLARFRDKLDVSARLQAFSQRCKHENATVVLQALRELVIYLKANQRWIHLSAITEQPSATIADLMRSLLDACARFTEHSDDVLELVARCIGTVGCLDPNRVETLREKTELVLLSNFDEQPEAVDFVTYLLECVLVKAFHSVANPRAQGFLAYVMQELLRFCGFDKEAASPFRPQGTQNDEVYQRWLHMSEKARNTLTPFLSSHYVLTTQQSKSADLKVYPIFTRTKSHGSWLRTLVLDLLQRPKGDNAKHIFSVLSRVIRGYDVSIARFILPFILANVVLGGTDTEARDIGEELLAVLNCDIESSSQAEADSVESCSENVFEVLDYLGRYVQAKKKSLSSARSMAARTARPLSEIEESTYLSQIACIERILSRIPAQVISRRAVECGSYARALYHWEEHMRTMKQKSTHPQAHPVDEEKLYQQLQDIYSQIDEPDGIDGISSYLHVLKPEQQVLEHRRAGRWAAAQSWYDLRLREEPENIGLHVDLLECLKHAGQHRLVLDHANCLKEEQREQPQVLSITSEAAWTTRNIDALTMMLEKTGSYESSDFNINLGTAMIAASKHNMPAFIDIIRQTRIGIAKTMSQSATTSLQACHDQLVKLHALYDVETVACAPDSKGPQNITIEQLMNDRLNVLGSLISEKQYLLAIRRATMLVSDRDFTDGELASTWLLSAKLARKENWSNSAYESVLNAAELGDEASKVEQAKLLWNDGEHNKAIRSLETAIEMDAFSAAAGVGPSTATSFSTATAATAANGRDKKQPEQNLVLAKAYLLLAKWLDAAGQTQSSAINFRYQQAARSFTRWEKGLYYLGRFYNKLLESEKALHAAKQNHAYLGGETAKLVVENFLRSLMFGCKYLFESVPKLLTLWLDFGIEISRSISKEVADDVRQKATDNRPRMLDTMNKQIKKYSDKLPAYLFYTSLPQMITRMGHPNKQVYELLAAIIIKVVSAHPQQGLWPLLAVVKSTAQDRAGRANSLLSKLMEKGKNIRSEGQSVDLRSLVNQGQKMSNQLLHACEVTIGGRTSVISLSKDMGFNGKVAPCPLVVPVDQHLSASLPNTTMNHGQVKNHKAFPASRDAVTISSFQDDVLVLNSLQRPRKLTVRGTDGRKYGLLCKPNDDLRKDQRLMEFNAMINRGLKKDAESSKRRLYIRTYAVTPLNEACGLIEWVDGLKPMRDILLSSYRARGTKVDYNLLRELLNEACSRKDGELIFSEQIVPMYEPVLHEWFTEYFPDPESWFSARLRYARSAAVTSMQGYALGLGDRHGENVLLEENTGGVFHVDFNCLFEKGLTFDKPELVPFRLTHNMVDAFGAYGVEGPFRRSAECAMKVMRANEDALLTILETFVYDPTADFVGARKRPVKGVPETPKEVLESVRGKLRGMMRGESVPLSVGGHVDALIKAATDPKNLCSMYIGWCAFL